MRSEPTISAWSQVRELLPAGLELPRATWEARHRFILWVVACHAAALPAYGLYRGWNAWLVLAESSLILAFGIAAALPRLSRRARAACSGLALVTSSAVLVQFSGGFIEAHFHYFIVVALVALYQDWVPFLLAILFVAVHHGVVGTLAPDWVYNHAGGMHEPWKWALIHAVAILGECVALLAFWSGSEQANARSDILLESAGEGIVGLDPNGRITFANPAAGSLLGHREGDLVGRHIQHFVATALPAGRRVGPREDVLVAADGTRVPIEWTLNPSAGAGTPVGAVMVLRDVSQRHAMEEQLRQHRVNLESMVAQRTVQLTQANRELEAFSYTVSHDLRSPLRTIDGFSRILLDRHGHRLPEDGQQMLRMLGDGAIRMGGLIESILALSRLSRIELRRSLVDVSALAQGILRELEEKEPGRKVQWSVEPDLRAEGDQDLLRLAVLNLLQNAWKFTGQVDRPRIRVRSAATQHGTAIVVEDNGAGFDMALAKDLFQPFHRLHTPSEFEGTGIGLATVSRIVQRHGGRIWADARVGHGARFWVTLAPSPMDDAALRAASTESPSAGRFDAPAGQAEPLLIQKVPGPAPLPQQAQA